MFTNIRHAACASVLFCAGAAFGLDVSSHYVLENNEPIPIPRAYVVERVLMNLGNDIGNLKGARDLFIDENDQLYVADTGNNRIIKLTPEGEVLAVFTGDERGLNEPSGVYVGRYGGIYIADTQNERILHVSGEGVYVEEFVSPESEILNDYFTFLPSKLYISPTGYLYVIKGQNIMILDAFNAFRGYLGQSQIGFDFNTWLARLFASEEQWERIRKRSAPTYTNLVVDRAGIIYATSLDQQNGQIKKLNSVGENIFEEQAYGEIIVDDSGAAQPPRFVDLTVDNNGIITALEQNGKRLYQYDQEGNLLAVFGGEGTRKGRFVMPTSLAHDSTGRIYVLDANVIQVLEPTLFINTVHRAVKRYSDGQYDEARLLWEQVQRIDENYPLAAKGIGKALYKQERWRASLDQYLRARDKDGYSQTFAEYRHKVFRERFSLVVAVLAVIIFVVVRGIILTRRTANEVLDRIQFRERET